MLKPFSLSSFKAEFFTRSILKKTTLLSLLFCVLYSCNKSIEIGTPIAYLQLEQTTLEVADVATGLDIPWDVDASIPDELWFTEQKGLVYKLNLKTGEQKLMLQLEDVLFRKSYGLLGMTVHPKHNYLFIHYTYQANEGELQQSVNSRVVRYDIEGDKLSNRLVLLDNIPGNSYHNGSRLVISPDDKLIFSMGDAGRANETQNDDILVGKIMRLNLDGSIPEDNPIAGSPIWSRGHRNPQGLTFGRNNMLYSSEHGPLSDDELNLIERNANYGWPDIHGFIDRTAEIAYNETHNTTEPLMAWTPTIAVAGTGYYDQSAIPEWQNSLIVANMKGRALRVLNLSENGREITAEHIYFQKYFGRLRDVSIAANGDIYVTTTNTDWHPRFQPWMYDGLPSGPDRILRLRAIDKSNKVDTLPVLTEDDKAMDLMSENWTNAVGEEEFAGGQKLYTQNCLACHNPEGTGAPGLYPPLAKTSWVTGDKSRLIRVLLLGLSEPIEVNGETYNQEMPSYAHLSNQQIAEVLTYIRNSFGNQADAVIEGEVFVERQSLDK